MSRLLSSLALLWLLLVAVQPASGMMSVPPENRVWDFFAPEPVSLWEIPSSGQYGTRESEAWGYEFASDVCDGPNLYAYVRQNPWTGYDPDGLAKINVIGGPTAQPETDHDNKNDNYLKAGVRNAKLQKQELNKKGSKEQVHMIVYEPSYQERAKNDGNSQNLDSYVKAAQKAGITVTLVQSAKEIAVVMNKIANSESVSELTYQGHSNAQTWLINYGQTTPGTASETMTSREIIASIPAAKTTTNFSCNFGGCNLGNTRAQNATYLQPDYPSMAESLSTAYKGSQVMGSAGRSDFEPIGKGRISPSSQGGYNYWKSGAVIKSDPAGQIPTSQIGLRALDLH